MGFADRKFELMVGGLVLVLLFGIVFLLKSTHTMTGLDSDIVYEMPRPKNFQGSDLDLSDREISRNYINPFDKKNAKSLLKDNGKVAQIGGDKAAADAAAAAAKKSASAAAAKKAQVTARVIQRTESAGLSGADGSVDSNNTHTGRAMANVGSGGNNGPADTTNSTEDNAKLSPDQWMALINGQPTQANILKLIEARNKGEVDSGTYNKVVAQLLKSSHATTQDLGLYAAQTFPDAESFIVVVQNEGALGAPQKDKAEKFLTSYKQASRINALKAVLGDSEEAVVTKAIDLVMSGYNDSKSIPARAGRGGDVTTAALPSFKDFIPLFKTLAESQDAAIQSRAKAAYDTLLAQIKTA